MLIDDILVTGLAIAFAYMFFIENWGGGLLRVQRALKAKGIIERKNGTRGVWRVVD